jgi:hypothetical protein
VTPTTKVFEQVEQSGLYAFVGECCRGVFVKAARPTPLRTMRGWARMMTDWLRTMAALLGMQGAQALPGPGQPPRMGVCSYCGETFERVRDAAGNLMPCDNCGRTWNDPAVSSEVTRFETRSVPASSTPKPSAARPSTTGTGANGLRRRRSMRW